MPSRSCITGHVLSTMLLVVHILTGAAIGLIIQNYWLIFVLAFISHLILDAVPHYEYDIEPLKGGVINKEFFLALPKPLADLAAGGLLIFWLAWQPGSIGYVMTGIFAALLLDGLSFMYWLTKFSWLEVIVSFHRFTIHPKNNKNTPFLKGAITQILAIAVAIALIVIFG